MKRKLGRSNIEVSAVGMGCWAIGGVWNFAGRPVGWGVVDDNESISAIHKAIDMGVNFFDTAATMGAVTASTFWRRELKLAAIR